MLLWVGPKGIHSVCVCQYHQNAKLLNDALPIDVNYQDVLFKIVFDLQNHNCMLHACDKCPGKEALQEYLKDQLDAHEFDLSDTIKYKQWVHTDRTTLISLEITASDFTDIMCESFNNLTQHHFIAKAQSKALNTFKENIDCSTAIILLDFAENYGFIIQDAVQGPVMGVITNFRMIDHPITITAFFDEMIGDRSYDRSRTPRDRKSLRSRGFSDW